jgi:hypothetical protein
MQAKSVWLCCIISIVSFRPRKKLFFLNQFNWQIFCRHPRRTRYFGFGAFNFKTEKMVLQMIRERISSGTVLLLAYTAANLRFFHVRRNAIILKCEWPKNLVRNATVL